jgi:hypothetical protein
MPIIPALGRQRQEDHESKTSQGYIVRSCLRKKIKKEVVVYVTAWINPANGERNQTQKAMYCKVPFIGNV